MTTLQRDQNLDDTRDNQNDGADDQDNGGGDDESGTGDDEDDSSGDDAEIEARARRMGWLPESEWDDERAEKQGRRKPTKFVSAREYIENAENSLPMLRSHLRNMDAKLNEATKQTAEIYEVLQEQRKMSAAAIERARKEEREKILKEREEAFDAGDKKAFQEAEAKLEELDSQGEETKPPQQEQQRRDPPEVVEFRKRNAWFTTDQRLTNNFIEEFDEVKQEKPDLSFADKMEEAKRRLMKRFPEKFGINPRRENARTSVHTPTGGRDDNSVEIRFSKLSPEEKGAWERVKKITESRGGKISKAEWMKEIGR